MLYRLYAGDKFIFRLSSSLKNVTFVNAKLTRMMTGTLHAYNTKQTKNTLFNNFMIQFLNLQ